MLPQQASATKESAHRVQSDVVDARQHCVHLTSGVYTYSVVKDAITAARPRYSRKVLLAGAQMRLTVAPPHSSREASRVLHHHHTAQNPLLFIYLAQCYCTPLQNPLYNQELVHTAAARLLDFPIRRGKSNKLSDSCMLVQAAKSEIPLTLCRVT